MPWTTIPASEPDSHSDSHPWHWWVEPAPRVSSRWRWKFSLRTFIKNLSGRVRYVFCVLALLVWSRTMMGYRSACSKWAADSLPCSLQFGRRYAITMFWRATAWSSKSQTSWERDTRWIWKTTSWWLLWKSTRWVAKVWLWKRLCMN